MDSRAPIDPATAWDPVIESAVDAAEALETASLTVRELEHVDELDDLSRVIDAIWHRSTPMIELGNLKAFAESGSYVVGAFVDGQMIGGAVAWLGLDDGEFHLHSHVAGFVGGETGGGRGRALKLHQRAWCLAHDISSVRWTFDPLVRRNGWFNLVKLGVAGVGYSVNHYGSLRDDGINGADESDRFIAVWDLESSVVRAAARGEYRAVDEGTLRDAGAVDLVDGDGALLEPGVPITRTGPTVLVLVPDDIVAIRQSDPDSAAAWRRATRAALDPVMRTGRTATAMTASGRLVVPPLPPLPTGATR